MEELRSKDKNQYLEEKKRLIIIFDLIIPNEIILSKNDDFCHKLQKLMKSICKADVRDHTLPNFTGTEYNLMKAFYKGKATSHDMKYLMVEDVIFLNIMQKLSKYFNFFFFFFSIYNNLKKKK